MWQTYFRTAVLFDLGERLEEPFGIFGHVQQVCGFFKRREVVERDDHHGVFFLPVDDDGLWSSRTFIMVDYNRVRAAE
jgi:hypothetical protein